MQTFFFLPYFNNHLVTPHICSFGKNYLLQNQLLLPLCYSVATLWLCWHNSFISSLPPSNTHTHTHNSNQISPLWLEFHCSTEIYRESRTSWAAIILMAQISSRFQTPGPGTGASTFHLTSPQPAGNIPLKLIVSAGPDHTHVHTNT